MKTISNETVLDHFMFEDYLDHFKFEERLEHFMFENYLEHFWFEDLEGGQTEWANTREAELRKAKIYS